MVNYDFIIKGPSFEKGTEVFYDIFLRYAQWLESVEDVHVLGFFEGPVTIFLKTLAYSI